MNNAYFSCIIVRDSVIIVLDSFACAICSGSNGGFTFATADYFNAVMEYRNKPSAPS